MGFAEPPRYYAMRHGRECIILIDFPPFMPMRMVVTSYTRRVQDVRRSESQISNADRTLICTHGPPSRGGNAHPQNVHTSLREATGRIQIQALRYEKGNRDSTRENKYNDKDMSRPATEHLKMIHKIIQILHDVRSCSLAVVLGPQHVCSVLPLTRG